MKLMPVVPFFILFSLLAMSYAFALFSGGRHHQTHDNELSDTAAEPEAQLNE